MNKVASQTQGQTKANLLPASGILQRKCACGSHTLAGGECEACSKKQLNLQRRAVDNRSDPSEVPPIVHDVLRSSGQPLDAETRSFMEPRFGHDFSQVRVHTDGKAAQSARAVSALAYTVGHDVVFGEGQYAPETNSGRRLLAHELTHTVQQSRNSVATLAGSMRVSEPGNADEREAEAVAEELISAGGNEPVAADIHPATSTIQRLGDLTKVPPGLELECEIASDSPLSPAENLLFANRGSTLSSLDQAQIDNSVR